MKTATVGEIQKNFARILKQIRSGEEITVMKRGKPVARLTALGPKSGIEWPDFYKEAVKLKGQSIGDILNEEREERL